MARIRHLRETDLVNLRMAVEQKYDSNADIECVWAHGADPVSGLKFYLVINTHDGSSDPFVPANAVYTEAVANTDGTVTAKPGGMTLTVDAAVANSYTAVSQLVTDNASATP